MSTTRSRSTFLAAALAPVVLAACGGSGGADASSVAASIQIVSGDAQRAEGGQELARPLVARVTNASGAPVRGQIVNFRVTEGGGSVFAGAAITDAGGVAQERWTLGPGPAGGLDPVPQRLEARAVDSRTGAPVVFATFVAGAVAPPPRSLSYADDPATYVTGRAIRANAPTSQGGAVALYTVAPPLPAGLAIDPATGVVTGKPTAAGAGTYRVTAANSGGSAAADLAITVERGPDPITVSGTVLSDALAPLAGARVGDGTSQVVTTDASGRFTLYDVVPPYDLSVVTPTRERGLVYQGLTRSDPVASFGGSSAPSAGGAGCGAAVSISGSISGGFDPAGGAVTLSLFSDAPHGFVSVTSFSQDTGAFTASACLSTGANLHALEQQGPAFRYGVRSNVSLAGAGPFTGVDVSVASVQSSTVSGTITAPDGVGIGASMGADLPDGATRSFRVADAPGAFSTTYPLVSGASYWLDVYGSFPQGSDGSTGCYLEGLSPDRTGLQIDLPPPPRLLAPALGAAVTRLTDFEFGRYDGGISQVQFLFGTPAVGSSIDVFTVAGSARLPDLSALGLPVPAGATGLWTVTGAGPFADLDAFTAPDSAAAGLRCFTSGPMRGFSTSSAF